MLQSMGSQRVGHDWVTEQQQDIYTVVLTNAYRNPKENFIYYDFLFVFKLSKKTKIKSNELWEKYTNLLILLLMSFVATWKDLEIIILSEVSQTQKDKYHMALLICGI